MTWLLGQFFVLCLLSFILGVLCTWLLWVRPLTRRHEVVRDPPAAAPPRSATKGPFTGSQVALIAELAAEAAAERSHQPEPGAPKTPPSSTAESSAPKPPPGEQARPKSDGPP